MIPLFPELHPRFRPMPRDPDGPIPVLSFAEIVAEEDQAFESQGKWIVDEVGFPLVNGNFQEFGKHCGFLIAELGQIAKRRKQGDMSGRRDAAKAIGNSARGLQQALHQYERRWGYIPPPGDFSAVSRRDAEAMLNRLSKQFEAESRDAASDMVWRAAFAKFISGSLSSAYKMCFGRKAAVSRNTYTGMHGGPFLRFARAILSAADNDASIADETIAKSLKRQKSKKKAGVTSKQKTEKAGKRRP